ncbi:MAG: hypothetical protein CMO64_08020 [Verrucomicrobiales bacterium]|nr:hypothetical protein [Verrucomicrobiales bacterium]
MSSHSSAASGKSIFISYRRDDSSANTGRIYDRLIQKFDQQSIFKDVDAIPIGVDFRKHLEKQVTGCRVLLAIIGPRWADKDRLQDEGDFVRIEIEYGLDPDRDILVVPVLVDNSSMPSTDQLPDSLKDFAFRNAIQVRPDPDFHKDMDKLIKTLTGVVKEGLGGQKRKTEAKALTHKPYRIRRREFYEPEELAVYLSENWADGVKHLEGGLITDWVKTDYRDQGLAIDLADIAKDEKLDTDQKLSVALLVMNNELPVFWRGTVANLDWLTNNPEKAIEISKSRLLHYYDPYRSGDELQLVEISKRVKEVAKDNKLEGEIRDLVVSLAVNPEQPLKLGKSLITPKWMASHPQKAIALCQSSLPKWQKRFQKETWLSELAQQIKTVLAAKDLDDKAKTSVISIVSDKESPLKWGRIKITPQWLADNPEKAINIFKGGLPEWYRRIRNEDWLLEKAKLVREANSDRDLKSYPDAFASVVDLILEKVPLKWGGEEISSEWQAANPKKAAIMLESPLPYWQARLSGNQSLIKARETWQTWRKEVEALGIPVDWDKVDELVLQTKQKWAAKFKAFLQKFERGEYVGSKNKKIQGILTKDKISPPEQIALLCCDEELFLTPQEKFNYDSIAYLKGFGVEMDWELAKKLIASQSWEELTPAWQRVLSEPLHPSLEKNAYIKRIFHSREAQYLDVVALVTADAAAAGTKLWEFETGLWVESSPAIGSDGTVYVGSGDKKLYAINGKNGDKLWEFETGSGWRSSPAIGSYGTVYVGSRDNKLYAINGKSGVKLWEFKTEGEVRSSPAISSDGTVYVGSRDNKLYAINGNGVKLWDFETGSSVSSSPAISSDGTVYVGSRDNKLYAINGKSGDKLWDFETGDWVFSSPAIGSDGTVYVGSWGNKLYAINGKTGDKLWEFVTGGEVYSSPAVSSDGTVYVGSNDNKFYAINGKTGDKLWEFETGGEVFSSPAIGSDGTVYVGSFDTMLYAINGKTGDKLWEFETGSWVTSSPAIGSDGTVYVGSNDNKLYAIRTDSKGLAKSPWPMRGQNARHTGRVIE